MMIFSVEPPLDPTPCGGFYQCPNGTVCSDEYVFIIIIAIYNFTCEIDIHNFHEPCRRHHHHDDDKLAQ